MEAFISPLHFKFLFRRLLFISFVCFRTTYLRLFSVFSVLHQNAVCSMIEHGPLFRLTANLSHCSVCAAIIHIDSLQHSFASLLVRPFFAPNQFRGVNSSFPFLFACPTSNWHNNKKQKPLAIKPPNSEGFVCERIFLARTVTSSPFSAYKLLRKMIVTFYVAPKGPPGRFRVMSSRLNNFFFAFELCGGGGGTAR